MKFLVAAATCNVLANLCLKQAALQVGEKAPLWGLLPAYALSYFFVFGLLFFFGGVVAFTKVLQTMPINVAYPVMSSAAFASVTIISAPLFNEKFGLMHGLGLLLIISGITLLSQQS